MAPSGNEIQCEATGKLGDSSVDDIAGWFRGPSYDGAAFFVRRAYFTGADDPFDKLRRALRADVCDEAWATIKIRPAWVLPKWSQRTKSGGLEWRRSSSTRAGRICSCASSGVVRFIWWLFIGWWASGIAVVLAWLAFVSIIGIPLGIWLTNAVRRFAVPLLGDGAMRANEDGREVVPDVRVGDRSMPWNARDRVGRPGPALPKPGFWASAKEGIDPVGCVHTAQGFEFDHVGVIFGPDLVYRPMGETTLR